MSRMEYKESAIEYRKKKNTWQDLSFIMILLNL